MLALYYKPSCIFSRQVIATIARLDMEVELRDISTSPEHEHDLVARGGKHQVPYLVDEAEGVEMYEADAIVAYLQKQYGRPAAAATTRPQVHIGGSVCLACEG